MEYRNLAGTGIKISNYSLGGGQFGVGATKEDAITIIHEAIDAGINLIDTADRYADGESEKIIGEAIKNRRDDIILATKVGAARSESFNNKGVSRRWIKQAVELSLQRLQTDYIDLYQLHHPFPDTDFEETLGILSDLVREGKIRYIGTSNHQAWQIAEAQAISERYRLQRFVSEEASYSILNRGIEKDITEVTRRYDVGILAYGALAAGLLTGKYTAGQAADDNSRAARYKGYALGQILDPERPENRRKFAIIEELQGLAKRAGMTLAHMAVAFTQSHPSVTSTILGPRTPEQLRTFLAGTEIRLGSDLLDAIDGIVAPGSMVDELDRGWTPEWLDSSRRRRI